LSITEQSERREKTKSSLEVQLMNGKIEERKKQTSTVNGGEEGGLFNNH
jgi:hypothetical protein